MIIVSFFRHLHTINKHRFKVFILSCKAGIPWRGLVHDLSKYSPTEFWEGVKYFSDGKKSPILSAKLDKGYSIAWLHHKGRNKHHSEFWLDLVAPSKAPVIPFKYAVEMVCDRVAAAKVYEKKKYSDMSAYYYWNKHRDEEVMNKRIQGFLTEVFELLLYLPKAKHQFKFIVDNKWICSNQYPTMADERGIINNYIDLTNYTPQDNLKEKHSNKKNNEYNTRLPLNCELNLTAPNIIEHYRPKFNLDYQSNHLEEYHKLHS